MSVRPRDETASTAEAEAKNRRRWERHEVSLAVNLTAFRDGQRCDFHGRASDISRGGLRLLLTRTLEPGESLQMEFQIPYSSGKLTLQGVVRNSSGFVHGVEFLHPSRHEQQLIERACKVLGLLR